MSILLAILLFSFLIFIHEFGHFIAAKLSGVQVNEFSIFMGPAIFKKQKGETLYAIRCIPIGGYCAMEGEDGESDNPRAFGRAAWWKRLIILVAGAGMNFLAGLLLLCIVASSMFAIGQPVIGELVPGNTISGEGGLQVGDRFLKIDGERVYVQADVSLLLSLNEGTVHDLVIERNGEKVYLNDFVMETHEFEDEDGEKSQRYGMNLASEEKTLGSVLRYVGRDAIDTVRIVRLSLQMLFTGKAGLNDMAGPVGIVQQISDSASQAERTSDAILTVVNFGAFIAINLAVMNMLPIPALDGGRTVCLLLTTVVEAITRKKINPKYEAYLHGIGMIVLLAFMALITFKDVFHIFKR